MKENTYRSTKSTKSNEKKGLFSNLNEYLHVDESTKKVIHVRFLSQIILILILCLLYISNHYETKKKMRTINKLEAQVEDLRADFTTLKASFMIESKQSEVTKRAKKLGLIVPDQSPIIVRLNEY